MASRKEKIAGFTLVEVLLVIAIIIVLLGVIIAIINPNRMRNKAIDVTTTATINKLALSALGYVSSYGYAPNEFQFFDSLTAAAAQYLGTDCNVIGGPDYTCRFSVKGSYLPTTCDSSHWTGTSSDTSQCFFRFYSGAALPANTMVTRPEFRIYAKPVSMPNSVFVFDSESSGQIFVCPYAIRDIDTLALCSVL